MKQIGRAEQSMCQAFRVRTPVSLLAACLLAAALITGCGSSASDGKVPTPTEARAALRGSPPPLAALHAQADTLVGDGKAAFARRLDALKGYPVVVNVWAAWCSPCKEEFPVLQRASVRYGGTTGFLGVNTRDVPKDARNWLDDHWTAYPSYVDHDGEIATSLGVSLGIPVTLFIDRAGRRTLHQGPYRDDAAFERDLQRYAGATPTS